MRTREPRTLQFEAMETGNTSPPLMTVVNDRGHSDASSQSANWCGVALRIEMAWSAMYCWTCAASARTASGKITDVAPAQGGQNTCSMKGSKVEGVEAAYEVRGVIAR